MRCRTMLLLFSTLVWFGCERESKVSDVDIPILTLKEVDDALSEPNVVLVDARKPDFFAQGHIPGAINIYLPDIRERDSRLADAKRIIVYSQSVRDPLGVAAAKRMRAMGYVNVQEYKGGIREWEFAGRSLVGSPGEADARRDVEK